MSDAQHTNKLQAEILDTYPVLETLSDDDRKPIVDALFRLARLREAASREMSYIEGIRQLCLEDRGRARSALRRMGARLRAAVEGGE